MRWALDHRSGRHPIGSAIGGRPVWIGGLEYPECPVGGKLTTYVAQIDIQDISRLSGYHTFFLHTECSLRPMVSQFE